MDFNQPVYEIAQLILKHLRGETSLKEDERLQKWLSENEKNRQFLESLNNETAFREELQFFGSNNAEAWRNIADQTFLKGERSIGKHTSLWKYAAIITLICVSVVALILYTDREIQQPVIAENISLSPDNDIIPGSIKASLELADGSVLMLEKLANGKLTSQNGAHIIKQPGQLIYKTGKENHQMTEVAYNKVYTPKGGEYRVILPDGSKVWLNALSSLRFPTSFTGKERVVEMTGEAFFEIAPDQQKPFIVSIGEVDVNVLGTHFNVMAYSNETSIKTTLLEGSIRITKGDMSKTIVPGQQARVGEEILLVEVDTGSVVAWKNGLFQFDNTSLSDIMSQLERWYDVKIDHRQIPTIHFTGTISKNNNISKVLNMLELTSELEFKIEENEITVSNRHQIK